MASRFFRAVFVCALITTVFIDKSGAQVVNLTKGVSGVVEIPHSLHVKDPENAVVPRGQPVTLRCNVRTYPVGVTHQLQITWLHDNVPIPSNDSRRIQQKDGSLFIPRVTAGRRPLTGNYRCRVRNGVGVLVSGDAKLQIATFDFDVTETKIDVTEYQSVILPCHAQSVPEAKVRWELNKKSLPHDSRYVPLPSGALLILKSLLTDTGIYRCIVTNSVLKRSKSKIIRLTVSPAFDKAEKISFLSQLPLNSTVTLGMRATLLCVANGWPLPKIEWLKDDTVISNSTTLNITNANQATSGIYTCRATNPHHTLTLNYTLNVQQKPYFTTTPKSKSYTSAGTVKLECTAGGYPHPCIRWYKNGDRLQLGGRIKTKDGVLVMSHTFTYDSGIYQCVATNAAGSVWTSAQVVLTSPDPPPPPANVRCRSYDERSVCITWDLPNNVMASAFSIYSFVKNQGCTTECQGTNDLSCDDGSLEESGPDYVTTSGNYYLATSLNTLTNYTFYVRLYSKAASDDSNKAFCSTGVKGERNLKFKLLSSNGIELKWSKISSDITCGNTSTKYIVQWKKEKHQMVNTSFTDNLTYNISGLDPLVLYHFRVMSSSYKNDDTKWVALTLPQSDDSSQSNRTADWVDFNNASLVALNAPTNPDGFRATKINPKSVTLNWFVPNENPKFYMICYAEIVEDANEEEEEEEPRTKTCEEGSIVKSLSNMKQIDGLKPNTLYEFRIRAHNAEGYYGPFSSPIEVRTHPDVPSTVLDLKYRIINESTACLAWLPPLYTNGKLVNYVVSYTPDPNWPLEEWSRIDVPTNSSTNLSCWFDGDANTISATLTNLKKIEEYTVIVRAGSDNGLSNPTFPFLLKTVNKKRVSYQRPNSIEEIANRQKMGVIAGCILALICITCCISCIILRRRCVKRRHLTHARLAASNNYYPAIARYATGGNTIQVRLENTCTADLHEIQNLVNDETNVVVPPAVVSLDTKGRDSLPNGHINGLKKPINGLTNGHVHITENPQYDKNEKSIDIIHAKSALFPLIHDDANSNRIHHAAPKIRHFLDLSPKKRHKCVRRFDAKNLFNDTLDEDFNKDLDLDVTQLTCLDETFIIGNHRRISPLLGPNG